jgi:hypothetical protein
MLSKANQTVYTIIEYANIINSSSLEYRLAKSVPNFPAKTSAVVAKTYALVINDQPQARF